MKARISVPVEDGRRMSSKCFCATMFGNENARVLQARPRRNSGHGYHRVHPNTNVILVWAWMLSSSSALERDRNCGSSMDALIT